MMQIQITLEDFVKQWLEDAGFEDAFYHTVKEFANTLDSIVISARSVITERSNKHENND